MLTFTRESAEEEHTLAEGALDDLLADIPAGQPIELVEFDGKAEQERAQLTTRCQAVLHARYESHRIAINDLQSAHAAELAALKAKQASELSALKSKNADEIEAIQTANRESKLALSRQLAEKRADIVSEHATLRAEYAIKVKAAKQRIKNAETVLRQLTRVGR